MQSHTNTYRCVPPSSVTFSDSEFDYQRIVGMYKFECRVRNRKYDFGTPVSDNWSTQSAGTSVEDPPGGVKIIKISNGV